MSTQTFQTFKQRCKILSEYVQVPIIFSWAGDFYPPKSNLFFIYTKESESEKESSEEWLGITRTVQKHYKRAFKKTELKIQELNRTILHITEEIKKENNE